MCSRERPIGAFGTFSQPRVVSRTTISMRQPPWISPVLTVPASVVAADQLGDPPPLSSFIPAIPFHENAQSVLRAPLVFGPLSAVLAPPAPIHAKSAATSASARDGATPLRRRLQVLRSLRSSKVRVWNPACPGGVGARSLSNVG